MTFQPVQRSFYSAGPSLNALNEYLSTLKISFSTIGISETWLNNYTESIYNLPELTSLHCQRAQSGVVGLYINSQYDYKVWADLQSQDTTMYTNPYLQK